VKFRARPQPKFSASPVARIGGWRDAPCRNIDTGACGSQAPIPSRPTPPRRFQCLLPGRPRPHSAAARRLARTVREPGRSRGLAAACRFAEPRPRSSGPTCAVVRAGPGGIATQRSSIIPILGLASAANRAVRQAQASAQASFRPSPTSRRRCASGGGRLPGSIRERAGCARHRAGVGRLRNSGGVIRAGPDVKFRAGPQPKFRALPVARQPLRRDSAADASPSHTEDTR
jgi:hypothetical protein